MPFRRPAERRSVGEHIVPKKGTAMADSLVHGNGEAPAGATGNGWSAAPLMRETLPIPDPKHVGLTTYDAKDPNTKYPPITMLRPPAGAPTRQPRPQSLTYLAHRNLPKHQPDPPYRST